VFRKVIAAIDGSDHAWKALELAADLAKVHGAELLVLHVVPWQPMPEALYELAQAEHIALDEEEARYAGLRALGDALTREAERRVRERGVASVSSRVAQGSPAHEILGVAQEHGADLLVLGSRGIGARGLLLGSVSHKVAHLAECTCVLVK
jgi:nucleotide-binding universal stress UspA family protein